MVKQILLLTALIISTVLVAGCTQQSPNPSQNNSQSGAYNVAIKDFAFSPSEITIKKGKTVTWMNGDSAPHTVVSDSGSEINSPSLSNGQTYSHTFNSAGTYAYHCSIHPGMKARIIVE